MGLGSSAFFTEDDWADCEHVVRGVEALLSRLRGEGKGLKGSHVDSPRSVLLEGASVRGSLSAMVLDKAPPDMQWHSALAGVVDCVVVIGRPRGGGCHLWDFVVIFPFAVVGTVGVVPWVEEGGIGGGKSLTVGNEGGLAGRRVRNWGGGTQFS